MSKEAMKMALEALERMTRPVKTNDETAKYKAVTSAITELRAALSQQGDPVACLDPLAKSQPLEANLRHLATRPKEAILAFGVEWAGRCAASALTTLAARQPPQHGEPVAQECYHDETERLGAIWTRCTQCGKKWADDEKPAQQEPVRRQFQGRDGRWHDFLNAQHEKNTIEDGTWPIRGLYPAPAPAQQQGEAVPNGWRHFPKSNSGVASDAIDEIFEERNHPVGSKAAARCGWEAAHRMFESLLSAPAKPPLSPQLIAIAAERLRQAEFKGWTASHDDEHDRGELAAAAASYSYAASEELHPINRDAGTGFETRPPTIWPSSWDARHWKHADPRRMLVKAGALILAELERIDRANQKFEKGAA